MGLTRWPTSTARNSQNLGGLRKPRASSVQQFLTLDGHCRKGAEAQDFEQPLLLTLFEFTVRTRDVYHCKQTFVCACKRTAVHLLFLERGPVALTRVSKKFLTRIRVRNHRSRRRTSQVGASF